MAEEGESERKVLDPYSYTKNTVDHLVSGLSANEEVVVTAVSTRNLLQDALIRQQLRPLAADALGRTMVCTLLMARRLKGGETLQITLSGDGPLRGVMAISDSEAGVRGYVGNPFLNLPMNERGNPDVSKGIGKGLVKVVRNHPSWDSPYNGLVEISNGEVAYDCAMYLKQSEQAQCALAAGVKLSGEALVQQAGGYLVQLLPGCTPETEEVISANIGSLLLQDNNPANLYAKGHTPMTIMEHLMKDLGPMKALDVVEPCYRCQCSEDRVFRTLRLLGKEEVQGIMEREENIEVKCEFCGTIYAMDHNKIREVMGIE
eukprot:CAMPEP_0113944736 /NCGR_PEP_ID=MMETSP1339-20121228/36273_1 /TAXON_ID=94617 /ORGANISM="Fibrocapsa japonica" /LENGTH=316 /DNA_ID=CAMNT_0000950039 /DNA_START=177 /DNA_END=1127 /DNA_ORIENTATION=- /assembly_acc=CAM_ASM_000762